LLRAVFGTSINEVVFTVLRGLAVSHPALAPEVQSLENTLVHFAEKAIQCIQSTIHVDFAMSLLSEPAPPTIVLRSATYGPKDPQRLPLSRADVTWILQSYIYDSLLRIPTGFHVYNLFGSVLQGQDDSIHHTLVIEAQVGNGDLVNASVDIIQGVVQSDLILSSTQPSEIVSLSIEVVNEAIFLATTGKNGLEIGGPSSHLFKDVYNRTDQVNFSENTLWGILKDGSRMNYTDGGWGVTRITDGSTLDGIDDSTYDFVLGSHYLEHLINPLQALASMVRVTKSGGHIVLILPRKERCFDHYRGHSLIEDMLFRYLFKVGSTDMKYSNLNHWMFGNDLKMDKAGNFYQMLARSIRFPENRAIHVHVFDLKLLEAVGKLFSLTVVLKSLIGDINQYIIFQKK
jgi:hypothetical protein